ncbi:MAG: tRNA pseudouridine(55) synthase TruB [Gallionella sp.]|nr:tRNA pseudouridine(55) synthase TruB [Gallionella sp.]
MARDYRSLDGVLLFDKPLELSSNTALQKVRHLYQALKAGHTGTLDPLATGLLPVCFGEATKFSTALLDADKTYLATMRLGRTTTTGDAEGEVLSESPVTTNEAEIAAVLKTFTGEISQIPPMHSALKHQGKPLYEYIRRGETIERQPRQVTIYELESHGFDGTELKISVRCSKGTYVRTLAEDIGAALGCGAHLTALRRTAIAHFKLSDGYTLQALQEMSAEQRDACIMPVPSLLPEMPRIELDQVQLKRFAQGQRLALDTDAHQGKVALFCEGRFVGMGRVEGRRLSVERLLSDVAKQAALATPAQELAE